MRKVLVIAVLCVAGYFVYMYFQDAPHVRLQKQLDRNWFNSSVNTTGYMEAVDRFIVSGNMHVKIYLNTNYQILNGAEDNGLRYAVLEIRNRSRKGPPATVEFIQHDKTVARLGKTGYRVTMVK